MQLFSVEKIKKRNIRKTVIHSMVLQSSYRDEQSLLHGSKFLDLNRPGRKKRKNWHVRLSCAWYLGKKNGNPYFSSIVGQCKPFQERLLSFRKFCYCGNLTSHFFSPLNSMFQWNRINDYFYFVGGNSWESWCNHFWTHGIHVI